MVTISIETTFRNQNLKRTAILSNDLSALIDSPDNEVTEITDFYFFEDEWFLTFKGFDQFSSIEIALKKNKEGRTTEVIGGSIMIDKSCTLVLEKKDIKVNVERSNGSIPEKLRPHLISLGIANNHGHDGCRVAGADMI